MKTYQVHCTFEVEAINPRFMEHKFSKLTKDIPCIDFWVDEIEDEDGNVFDYDGKLKKYINSY